MPDSTATGIYPRIEEVSAILFFRSRIENLHNLKKVVFKKYVFRCSVESHGFEHVSARFESSILTTRSARTL